ncbi:UDP-4-amino-4-deoxy-L-arabinose--oxoglutarate aminotransferase [Trichinella pseudospiralis]
MEFLLNFSKQEQKKKIAFIKVLCGKVCWKFASWKIFVPSGDLFCFPHRDSWLNATTLLDAQISIIFMHCFMKQEKEEGGGGGWEKAHFQVFYRRHF